MPTLKTTNISSSLFLKTFKKKLQQKGKNYSCPRRGYIFWKRCMIASFLTLSNTSFSI